MKEKRSYSGELEGRERVTGDTDPRTREEQKRRCEVASGLQFRHPATQFDHGEARELIRLPTLSTVREVCPDCFQPIKAASPETLRDAVYGQGDVHLDFLNCSNRGQHCASDCGPLTRFQHHEIAKLIDHMQEVPLSGRFTSASRIVSSAGIAPTPSTASDGIPAYEIL
ncbi:hypothetical protein B0H13DRAFT_1882980 [Mycena leptocephala]|nr:hypothetical protein B0H13DRAFT_1882980 [Mycena leptocephala]